MSKKKWLLLIGLVIGGMMVFFSLNGDRQLTQEEQQHQMEVSIAKLLVNEYEDVKEITFRGWRQSPETGMWRTSVMINKTNRLNLSFNDLYDLGDISGGSSSPDTFQLVEKSFVKDAEPVRYRLKEIEATSLEGISITYSSAKAVE